MRIMSWTVSMLLIVQGVFAGPNRWTTTGPIGARVSVILADPGAPDVAYAETAAGIYKTTNGGASWQPANSGLPFSTVGAFIAAPGVATTLYAAVDGAIFSSADGAEHWSRRGTLPNVNCLAFDPASSTLYAGTTTSLFFSDDGGENWIESRKDDASQILVHLFAISANAAYALVLRERNEVLMRSTDHGRTWETFARGHLGIIAAEVSSPTIYVIDSGIFSTADDGKSWTKLPTITGFPGIFSILVFEGNLYAATSGGLFEYVSSLKAWNQVGEKRLLLSAAIGASSPNRFYAGADIGVVTMLRGDSTWSDASSGLPGAYVREVAFSASQPAVAYAGTIVGTFKTVDAAQSWRPVQDSREVRAIAVDPRTPDTVVMGTPIMKSTNGGVSWTGVAPGSSITLDMAQSDPATIYAALSAGLSKSTNGGDTWTLAMSGLSVDDYDYYGFTATAIRVDPSNASNVYVAKYGGLFSTTNGGAQWNRVLDEPFLRAIAIDPANGSTVYAARDKGGVIKSTDSGATWTRTGLVDRHIQTLALAGNRLYAGAKEGHVYFSDDGGESWNGLEDGFGRGPVSRIAVDPTGEELYAATGAGVYEFHFVNRDVRSARVPTVFPDLNNALVIPIAGTVRGIGADYTTELSLTNPDDLPENVDITLFPQAGESVSFRVTLPQGTARFFDLRDRLGISGIGALAMTSAGVVDASARIWTHPAGGRAPFSQAIPLAAAEALSEHARATMANLREDSATRINIGVVNLSEESHQFIVHINGERSSGDVMLVVPPHALGQAAIPDADYGALTLDVTADSSNARWVVYATSIDRATGEAQTVLGTH